MSASLNTLQFSWEHLEQIGSVKGPKNFASDQTVFHRDDVPAARRERKKEVKQVILIPLNITQATNK